MSLLYDPRDPETNADPIPVLRRLQDEDPMHWCAPLRGWVVTRYDDVRRVHISAQMSADRLTPFYEKQPPDKRRRMSEVVRPSIRVPVRPR